VKVIIFGATGMIGSGVLQECLDDPEVRSVLVLNRGACGIQHQKLQEIIHSDFFDYSEVLEDLTGYDACFFCLGVSAAGMTEEEYHHLTYELTMAAAETLVALNPEMTFCYVSGQGTDSTEEGRFMWARVKGKTENHLLRLPFKAAFMFRPGYIQPMKGVRTKVRLSQAMYTIIGPLYPLLKRIFPRQMTTSQVLGRAMIRIVSSGFPKFIIDIPDINELGEAE
jgi:uncharacterized protein YbjT (DUF2867 family)